MKYNIDCYKCLKPVTISTNDEKSMEIISKDGSVSVEFECPECHESIEGQMVNYRVRGKS